MDTADSTMTGGAIPGLPGTPVFTVRRADASPIPVLVAVPHAGRAYPGDVIETMRNPAFAALRLEDRYADLLAGEVAARTGAALLVAHAPRAMLDLNRAPDDVDWEMFGRPPPRDEALPRAGRRARSGLGLIPRRLPGLGELWRRRLDERVLVQRIATVHAPYHAALAAALESLRSRWGAAMLVDLHSMPPLPVRAGEPGAEFVIGDRFGASCDGALVGAAFGWFVQNHRKAAHNRPYAGGYVLERHADTAHGIHCLQLEVDRRCYLDHRLAEPGPGFAATAELLAGLVRRLAGEVALLGSAPGAERWAVAAE
ncbi:MAG: N-formylglutamate amidohydrolase [Novosphingobium sp.]